MVSVIICFGVIVKRFLHEKGGSKILYCCYSEAIKKIRAYQVIEQTQNKNMSEILFSRLCPSLSGKKFTLSIGKENSTSKNVCQFADFTCQSSNKCAGHCPMSGTYFEG